MIDWFRLVAALMVIAIHTAPFDSINKNLDIVLTYGLGRIAVPFFLITSGYFVIGPYWQSGFQNRGKYVRFLKKILLLYGVSILLYIPLKWYAKKLPKSLLVALKMLIFDGTFYHLWYFPAVLLGTVLTVGLLKIGSKRQAAGIALFLYLIGLMGDSYYGISANVPLLHAFYEGIFLFSSYTRNGIFYAPLFLLMGALFYRQIICPSPVGCIAALLFLSFESGLTYYLGLQRHNSMYLSLPVAMYFFYPLLLAGSKKAPAYLRSGTSFLYIIHPISIVLVRAAAGMLKMEEYLVEQSLIHYCAVCALSLVLMAYDCYALQLVKYFTGRNCHVSKRKSMD